MKMHTVRLRSRRVAVAAAALLTMGTVAAVVPALAATPAGGTVSDTAATATWTAGPFAVPNATGAAGDPVCDAAATPCDDFTLHVERPGRLRRGPHACGSTCRGRNAAADFDVYVLDASGASVSSAASSSDPEPLLLAGRPARLHRARRALRAARPVHHRHREARHQPGEPGPEHARRRPASATTPHRSRSPTRTTPASRRSASTPRPARRCTRPTLSTYKVDVRRQPAAGDLGRHERQRRQRLPAAAARPASTRSCSPTTRPAARSSRSWPARPR